MSRRLALVAAVALLVVATGCLGGASTAPGTTDATTTTTTTADPTTATTTTPPVNETTRVVHDCGYNLHVETATQDEVERADEVYEFEELPQERREEFRAALKNGTLEMETLPDRWGSPRIVEYDSVEYYTVVSTC